MVQKSDFYFIFENEGTSLGKSPGNFQEYSFKNRVFLKTTSKSSSTVKITILLNFLLCHDLFLAKIMALKTSPPSCLSGLLQLALLMKWFMQISFAKHCEKNKYSKSEPELQPCIFTNNHVYILGSNWNVRVLMNQNVIGEYQKLVVVWKQHRRKHWEGKQSCSRNAQQLAGLTTNLLCNHVRNASNYQR